MDTAEIWRTIDEQRGQVSELMEGFSESQLLSPSLCAGWTVRDVGAHLSLSHTGLLAAAGCLIRARGSFNRMIHDTAIRKSSTAQPEIVRGVRSMIGSRRLAPGVTPMEPLTDVLVHTQDMARPLGIEVRMPGAAAVDCTRRVYSSGFPFFARRRLKGFALIADDADLELGEGDAVVGPVSELLLLVTGRVSALARLGGPGAYRLSERLESAART